MEEEAPKNRGGGGGGGEATTTRGPLEVSEDVVVVAEAAKQLGDTTTTTTATTATAGSKVPNHQRKNIRVVAKPRATNQNGRDEANKPRPASQGLDGVVSKRVVFEKWAESQNGGGGGGGEERPSTKRQLSAESVAKCVSLSKRREPVTVAPPAAVAPVAVAHTDTHVEGSSNNNTHAPSSSSLSSSLSSSSSKAGSNSGGIGSPAAKAGKPLAGLLTRQQHQQQQQRSSKRRTTRKQLFKSTDVFRRVDTHAISAGKELREQSVFSASSIAQCVTQGARTELEKLRAIWAWLCHNIVYDLEGYLGESPKLCSPDEVIKEGRGVCCGYSSVCLEMCREVGIKCQEVSGYSKGIGYQSGGQQRGAESDHMWNVVWLEGQWWLLDSCWGAGRVDMRTRNFIRNYDDFYFLTEPSEFIDTHFPDQSEWQLLDTPIDWEEFAKRAVTSSAFYSLGLKLKQHHRVTTDDGQAKVCMSFPRPMSVTYELIPHHALQTADTPSHTPMQMQSDAPTLQEDRPPPRLQRADSCNSSARLSVTSLGMTLQLSPPAVGSYNLQLFARPLSEEVPHVWVCTVEVVCPVVAEREEIPLNPFVSWGLSAGAKEMGVESSNTGSDAIEVGESGEYALTIKTSRPLMMLCEFAHISLEPALAKRCLAMQIGPVQLACHVICPLRGFYRLSVFVRDYSAADGNLQNAGNFLLHCRNTNTGPVGSLFPPNLSPWCGPGTRTEQAGLSQFSHAGPVVSLPQGRCNISFHKDCPDLQVHAGLSVELHQEAAQGLSTEPHEESSPFPLSRHLLLTQMDGKVTVSVCVPRPGVYRLSLYGRQPPQQDYSPLCEYVLRSVCQERGEPFPGVYAAWGRGCVLLEPRGGVLLPGRQVTFRVRVAGARSVCVIGGDKHTELKMNKSRVWEGQAVAGHGGDVKLAAATAETDNMAILLTWDVASLPNEL